MPMRLAPRQRLRRPPEQAHPDHYGAAQRAEIAAATGDALVRAFGPLNGERRPTALLQQASRAYELAISLLERTDTRDLVRYASALRSLGEVRIELGMQEQQLLRASAFPFREHFRSGLALRSETAAYVAFSPLDDRHQICEIRLAWYGGSLARCRRAYSTRTAALRGCDGRPPALLSEACRRVSSSLQRRSGFRCRPARARPGRGESSAQARLDARTPAGPDRRRAAHG